MNNSEILSEALKHLQDARALIQQLILLEELDGNVKNLLKPLNYVRSNIDEAVKATNQIRMM